MPPITTRSSGSSPLRQVRRVAARFNAALREPTEAIKLAKHACKLTQNKAPNCLSRLFAAHTANGEFPAAIDTAARAAALASADEATDIVTLTQDRLKLYQTGKAYIQTLPPPSSAQNPGGFPIKNSAEGPAGLPAS